MFIEIECNQEKANISNLEFKDKVLSLFSGCFFNINFGSDEEEMDFLRGFLKSTERTFSNGQSYAEVEKSLLSDKEYLKSRLMTENVKKMPIRFYRFVYNSDNSFGISFFLDRGNITFFLYQDLIDKIKKAISEA